MPFFCCPSAILSPFIISSYSFFHSFPHLSRSPFHSPHRSPSAHPSTAINNCLCHRSAQPKPMRSGQTHPSHMLLTNTHAVLVYRHGRIYASAGELCLYFMGEAGSVQIDGDCDSLPTMLCFCWLCYHCL